jgi:hypothetical protein
MASLLSMAVGLDHLSYHVAACLCWTIVDVLSGVAPGWHRHDVIFSDLFEGGCINEVDESLLVCPPFSMCAGLCCVTWER